MAKKVALLIETSRGFGRELLRGVAGYARTHGPWSIYRDERGLSDAVPDWLRRWQGDGIVARIESPALADYIQTACIPTIDLRARYSIAGVPTIATNDLAIVRMACDHLLIKGVRNFGFCGFQSANYSESRLQCTNEYLAEHDITPSIYLSPHGPANDTTSIESEGMLHLDELGDWLIGLPKPAGIVACNDVCGAQVLSVCRERKISVPEEVAVIGVDNDPLICDLTTPPLSSVVPDAFRVGYLAGELLDHIIDGTAPPPVPTLVNPLQVVPRQSTDIWAVEDEDVMMALTFIKENACKGISVDDVAKAVHLSRSTLDRRFSRYTGTTAKSEIIRVRGERVKQLLVHTDYSLSQIAAMVGFSHTEYMCTTFKEITGETPGQYRRLYQVRRLGLPEE